MYYSDLVAAAEKDTTARNFCCLVDAAVMLYEEEEQLRKGKEDEESYKRIFQLFPRKTRTSVKKLITGGNPQQTLNGASTSLSSFLLDLNTIPADDSEITNPKSPSFSSSLLLDFYSIAPNPNGASSSSLSFLGDYKKMKNPRNPNSQLSLSSCLTEKKSHKRRAPQDNKRCVKSKKARVDTYSWIGRETPESLIHLMRDTNESVTKWGERTDLKLIFQRKLFTTDVTPGESRLSMPFNELICKDFLTPAELRIIREDINNVKKRGVGAILVDEQNVKYGVMLKRWEMKKDSGNGSWNYALTCGWNDVVKGNGLKLDDDISIWCFRWGGLLCFALVTPPPSSPSIAQSSSPLALCL